MLRARILPALALLVLAALPHASQAVGDSNRVPSGAGTSPGSPRPGTELPKPGGGTFFLDANQNGRGRELVLEELVYGRLVHVHGLDGLGHVDPQPVFRDFLVGESVPSDGVDYLLVPSPATGVEHLIVLRQPGAPEPAPGAGTFSDLVRAAERLAVPVPPRVLSSPFVTEVPRNTALGLRFSDLLDDGPSAAAALPDNVRVAVGPPPQTPFQARVLFDAHHGGVAGGQFHSTRILIDATVSRFEASDASTPLIVDVLGFPSASGFGGNVLVRLPTRLSPGTGQFTRLTNLAGRALATNGNGPVDPLTLDVVRAARGGDAAGTNGGFLADAVAPTVLGAGSVSVTAASPDPAGAPGFAFLVDWTFATSCTDSPRIGDALESGGRTFEVIANGPPVGPGGTIHGARVLLAQKTAVSSSALLGAAALVAELRPEAATSACWFGILPAPAQPPGAGLATSSQIVLRFSEPLRTDSIDPYDDFRLVQGPPGVAADATNTVVAELLPAVDLSAFTLEPVLPLAHAQGTATRYHVELVAGADGPTDLAGNALVSGVAAGLRIAPGEPSQSSGGLVLRFSASDEMPGPGADLRGPFLLDAGRLRPRAALFFSAIADRTRPVPSIMIPYPGGVQTPLNPLGAKLQSVWRHCDLAWSVFDESKYDVDVVGASWSPRNGQVINDFFEGFEIRLAHSARLPDEDLSPFLLPKYPNSGSLDAPHLYTENILDDPASPQKVVHARSLGYTVNAANLFLSTTGTPMLPYPLNRGAAPIVSYTWHDTSVLAKAGPAGAGVPLDVEVGPPLFLEPQVGSLAPAGAVPSVALPLLLEFRCYPSNFGIGLNAFDTSLAINSSSRPSFRAFSAGGINRLGHVVTKDPDLELTPSGAFNPISNPPGAVTPGADNVAYLGQLDLAYRVTRVHSAWFDTGGTSPDYVALQLAANDSGETSVHVDLRGATGFSGTGGAEGDAAQLDAYGDVPAGSVAFLNGDPRWHDQLNEIDGARYVQLRLTLQNDLQAGTSPTLDNLALAFQP